MDLTISEVIVWLIVGALAGMVIGSLVKRKKEGFGALTNLGIGLVGAVIGGVLFNIFKIDLGLSQIQVSLQDIISACVGSLIFLLIIWGVRKHRGKSSAGAGTS